MGYQIKYYKDAIYLGELNKNGKREGIGLDIDYKGFVIYEGFWKNGLPEGNGVEYRENGSYSYQGEWVRGEKKGQGKEFMVSGDLRYEGSFEAGVYSGFGVLYSFFGRGKGIIEYEGWWKKGVREGSGKEYYGFGEERGKLVSVLGRFVEGGHENGVMVGENGKVVVVMERRRSGREKDEGFRIKYGEDGSICEYVVESVDKVI